MQRNISCLFIEIPPEEAVNVTGGNVLAGIYIMAAFFIANGGAFLTSEQAFIVMLVTLSNSTVTSAVYNNSLAQNISQTSTFDI
ncbi:hypothetical protein BCV64_12275 [Cylindrospermopsis raciborskii MVCC14]|nr:hypothetical protein BCV64_12275 [Cylindrospermopsis raciborskii MVCC14]